MKNNLVVDHIKQKMKYMKPIVKKNESATIALSKKLPKESALSAGELIPHREAQLKLVLLTGMQQNRMWGQINIPTTAK